jgi:hypothetical protein
LQQTENSIKFFKLCIKLSHQTLSLCYPGDRVIHNLYFTFTVRFFFVRSHESLAKKMCDRSRRSTGSITLRATSNEDQGINRANPNPKIRQDKITCRKVHHTEFEGRKGQDYLLQASTVHFNKLLSYISHNTRTKLSVKQQRHRSGRYQAGTDLYSRTTF